MATICTPRCGPNQSTQLPNNWTPPDSGNGLPDGGEPGQIIVNTGPGEGEWQDMPAGALPEGGEIGQVLTNTGPGQGEWAAGTPGPEGPEGPIGPEGPEGPAGPEGPQGVEGPEGPQGPAGPDGPAGAQGIPGPQGMSLTIDEYGILDEAKVTEIETAGVEWWFLVDPSGDDRVNQAVPAGISGDMERHLIVYDPDGPEWKDFGQFTGIQGPPGPQGAQGNPGPQGNPGVQGIQGVPGPQGATGATGAAGAPGTPGTDGDSAYEIAVANGFVGTEIEWLASLEGQAATTQPTFDITLLHDTAIPVGTYPLTIYQPIAYTFTKLTHRTMQGTIGNLRLRKNGTIVATVASVTTTRVTTTINVPVVVGDILELELTTVTGVRRFDAALS